MKVRRIGSILDEKVLRNLGFQPDTNIAYLLDYWEKVQKTYNANVNRQKRIDKLLESEGETQT